MTSKERLLRAWNGELVDHVPLTTWSFGFKPPAYLTWENNGRQVEYWYSKRLEHIHTLPQSWDLEDDFKRVLAWQSLGVDDILDVSVPWSISLEVTWKDSIIPSGGNEPYPVMVREYQTPSGPLRHAVRKTGEDPGSGWVIQPEHVPLFEDYNIPRAVEHAMSKPEDVPTIKYLYQPPDKKASAWFTKRMENVKAFADEHNVAVQAWSAFGMDAVVWLTGTEGAVMLALDNPKAFGKLVDIIAGTDLARTQLAAATDGVDMVVERGWYSSTDFWSPKLFEQFVYPHITELASCAHRYGKKFGYAMTTGVETLGPRLSDAGVDVLYFVDPVQDRIRLERARELFSDRLTMVGGTNALSLSSGNPQKIREEVRRALDILGLTNRFILHPVDAIFPDTPWEGVEIMIGAWKEFR